MPASAAATAVVHFVGIIVFSTNFSATTTSTATSAQKQPLLALMPSIPPKPGVLPRNERLDVEPHTALIAFPEDAFISAKGWNWPKTRPAKGKPSKEQPPPFPKDPHLLWVQLDGEQMEVLPDGKKPAHPQLIGASPLPLPHITSYCQDMKLNRAFQKPYKGAAAVFEVPVGEVSTCLAQVHGTNMHRVDTTAKVPNHGTVVLRDTRSGKTIVLDGNATIYVAHIPQSFIDGQHYGGSQSHDSAYWAMGIAGHCNGEPFAPSAGITCQSDLVMGHYNVTITSTQPPPPPPPPQPNYFADVNCSNSQWP